MNLRRAPIAVGATAITALAAVMLPAAVGTALADAQKAASSPVGEAQLRTIVPDAATAAGLSSQLVTWGQRGSTWEVGLSKVTPAATAALKRALGPDTVVFAHQPFRTAIKSAVVPTSNAHITHVKVTRSASSGHGARPEIPNPPPPGTQTYPNRLLDAVPYNGGDSIIYTYPVSGGTAFVQCTAATLSTKGMLMAGHCDDGIGKTVWTQGYYHYTASTKSIQAWGTGTYGITSKSIFANSQPDAAVLASAGSGFTKNTYLDTQFIVPSKEVIDNGSAAVKVGTKVCTDGSPSDYRCGGTVTRVNFCVSLTETLPGKAPKKANVCHLDEATSSSAIVQSGDSGGPVFLNPSPAGRGTTVGIISGMSGSKVLLFTDIAYANKALGTTVIRG